MIEYKNKFIHIKIREPDNADERKLFYEDFESATRLWAALENVTLQQRMEEEDIKYVHIFGKGKTSH
tara:strand:- start:7773 stop:7973 length:201 start_codon:yes stop_codon:yes gene_type:complete